MLQIGDIQIHLINDGDHWVDPGGPFGLVPRVLWQRYFTPSDDQLIHMALNNLLVRVGDQHIIIDTGYGDRLAEKMQRALKLQRPRGGLLAALSRLGVQPTDIDLVINTHLHSDHCTGNMTTALDGTLVPVFPNAEYVTQRREHTDASQPNERTRATYLADNFQPLVESGQMRLLDGETELVPGVRGVITPGHTPGHMSIVFESRGESAVFLCDTATYAVHFERLGWMTAYDVEPMVTLETKRQWQQWALTHDATLIFGHDPYRPVGRLTEADGKMQVISLNEPYA